jgi:hypothetical protein
MSVSTVADFDPVTAFFVGLGLEVEGTRIFVDGYRLGRRRRRDWWARRSLPTLGRA